MQAFKFLYLSPETSCGVKRQVVQTTLNNRFPANLNLDIVLAAVSIDSPDISIASLCHRIAAQMGIDGFDVESRENLWAPSRHLQKQQDGDFLSPRTHRKR